MGAIKQFFVVLAVIVVFVIGGILAYWKFGPKPEIHVVDRMCEFVRNDQKMECVAVLTDDTAIKPGSIVDYQVDPGGGGRVQFPNADLFGEKCLVPGADVAVLRKGIATKYDVSIPQLTYEVNTNLQIGADVEIPTAYDMTFKAGPNWSKVSKIEMSNDKAWAASMDEIAAVDAYASCQIRTTCVNYIKTSKYSVVGATLVAQGLKYKVYDKNNDVISLEGGAKSDEFSIRIGAGMTPTSTTNATVESTAPRVVGVRLLPGRAFTGQQTCEQDIVYNTEATTTVRIAGGGGQGNIGPMRTEEAPLDKVAELNQRGTEKSECDDGFERKQSEASANARAEADGPAALKFSYRIRASGGHYATAATCIANQVIGKTGHDTTAIAGAEMKGTIFVLMRSDNHPTIRVDFSDMPPGAQIQILNFRNDRLQMATRRPLPGGDFTIVRENTPATVQGGGEFNLETQGAGLYRVETTFQISNSVTGNDDKVQEKTAAVRVTIPQ